MQIKTKPETEVFVLKCDPEGNATVTIRQARTGDNLEIARLFDKQSRVLGSDAVEIKQEWNYELLKRKRAWRTLADAANLNDQGDKPLFRFKDGRIAMSEDEFNRVWGQLPIELTEEISQYILVVNPQWNPLVMQGE
jgi:hypothetical protein